jgi:hypothetical protein
MASWHPAHTATQDQANRAMQLLKSSIADGSWEAGKVLVEEGGVQYRAAWHPNKTGSGQHQGVEVWLPEASPMTVTTPSAPTDGERELVLQEGERRGWPREELFAAIMIESGWNPAAHNVQGFGGLIGFNPGFAKKHAGSKENLWRMSIAQQAPLVGRYLDDVGKKWRVPGDTYMAIGAPAFVGAPDNAVVYKRGSAAWEQNPGWRGPDGEITAGSMRALLLRKMRHLAGGSSPTASPKESPESPEPQSLSFFLEALRSALHPSGHITGSGSEVAAVCAYQASQGLFADGLIGAKTLARMLEQAKKDEPA